jgi:hypothetical protein
MRGLSAGIRGAEERAEQAGTFFPRFMLKDGEAAIIRFLAVGGDEDTHIGQADVHMKVKSYEWQVCPTSFDNESGDCACPPGTIPEGFAPKKQVGVYVWVYRYFYCTAPEFLTKRGVQLQQWGLSPGSLGFLNDDPRYDKQSGIRWVHEANQPACWFRGPDMDQAFPKRLQQLTALFGGNLSGRDVMIFRKEGRTPRGGGIKAPDWIIEPLAEDWPEMVLNKTDELKAEQVKYYQALPSIRDFFMKNVHWPLFDAQGQAVPVPERVAASPVVVPAGPIGVAPGPVVVPGPVSYAPVAPVVTAPAGPVVAGPVAVAAGPIVPTVQPPQMPPATTGAPPSDASTVLRDFLSG